MEKAINMINEIKSTLHGFENADDKKKALVQEIESAIGKRIPDEVKSFYVNSSPELSESTMPVFMGYEPIDLESLAGMYRDPKDQSACCFLATFAELSDDLILGDDEGFEIIQDLDDEVDDGEQVFDMKTVLPIMSGSGYYIVLLYKPDGETELAIATEDYCLSSFAPGLQEHLANLESGIKSGAFEAEHDEEYDELEIEFPEIWSERVEMVA